HDDEVAVHGWCRSRLVFAHALGRAAQALGEVDLPVAAEPGAELAAGALEAHEASIHRADVYVAAVDGRSAIGEIAVVGFADLQIHFPDLAAGLGVERCHGAYGRGEVEPAIGVDRRRLER